ncbi:MAG TPA: MEDS domain-containing protein [Planctomycetota bacterium]|jgi:two-component system sensor kinase|nr:MEDS domain-containing protein [Planctomycetota bacterium]
MTSLSPAEVSRHKCLVYEGHPSEQLQVVIPFLLEGRRENYRCLYLGDPQAVAAVGSALAFRGVDVAEETRRGGLVLSSERPQADSPGFDPCAMVAMLSGMIDDAVGDGYAGLCATGDMAWELGAEKNFERLLEYEVLLERLFKDKPLTGICQYRREALPRGVLREALLAHRSVYLGHELLRDNVFFVHPDVLLGGTDGVPGDVGQWMCDQIRRVLRAEQERDRAISQLAEMNRTLEVRVRERTDDLESFACSVSHDLRAPLRAMDGFAQILLEDERPGLSPEGKSNLDRIRDSAERMRRLIDSIMELSRSGHAELRLQTVDMSELAESTFKDLAAGLPAGRASLTLGALPPASGDRDLLRQVFSNLIGNALKYSATRPQSRVEIGATPGAGEVAYWVRDNGIGFDMRDAQKLFEFFQRLHPQGEFEGSGVGLGLVKRIVRRHGGRVWAEGNPGKGATFYFALPGRAR